MAARKDYYATLEVAKGSGADEIKRAYRKLARKWHPDVNPGDTAAEERFKEISEAYHVIGDEKRRKQYDQVGPEAFAQEFDMSDFGSQFGSFFRSGFGGGAQPRGGADFGMFEEVLGGGFGQARASRPPGAVTCGCRFSCRWLRSPTASSAPSPTATAAAPPRPESEFRLA